MMTRVLSTTAAAALAALLIGAVPVSAQEGHGGPIPARVNWSFAGVFGRFDTAQLQRGFQVYKEVCAACHGMLLLSYRNLRELGLTEQQVVAIASQFQIQDGPNDEGQMF